MNNRSVSLILQNTFNRPLFVVWERPQVTLEQWSFLEKKFAKTKLEERTWAKLVTLDTIYWYCDRLEPTPEAHHYDSQMRERKSVTNTCEFCIPLLGS